MDKTYEENFSNARQVVEGQNVVWVQHYPNGPSLRATCYEFIPTERYQFHALKKNAAGWHSVRTTAYTLASTEDMSSYVRSCVGLVVDEACDREHPTQVFFRLARVYSDEVSNSSQVTRLGHTMKRH
jgi:hypothetical protein